MRILVVGPTGRTGSHVIDALRARDPDVSIRGLSRYPDMQANSIEVIPGNTGSNNRREGTIGGASGNTGSNQKGGRRERPVGGASGNTGSTRGRSEPPVEDVPGNTGNNRGRTGQTIEVVATDTASFSSMRRDGPIETVPGNTGSNRPRTRVMAVLSDTEQAIVAEPIEWISGDLENPADRALAVEGIDLVVHYAPAFHPREAAMGTGMIDAAVAAGVRRFIYVSALHAQAGSVPGHASKLEVEGYLAGSGLDWTILRPQNYMQNIDVAAVIEAGALELPMPVGTRLGHLDMADLAEVIAKIANEDGHAFATYDIASNEALSTVEIAALITTVSGTPVASGELPIADLVAGFEAAGPEFTYVVDAVTRLNTWQTRNGGRGNANTLRWLLGREPSRFEDYVRRSLETASPD